jgi:hypothetical protein
LGEAALVLHMPLTQFESAAQMPPVTARHWLAVHVPTAQGLAALHWEHTLPTHLRLAHSTSCVHAEVLGLTQYPEVQTPPTHSLALLQ